MKRLVLLGGGHAQLFVLEALAAQPLAGVEVLLVSPSPRQIYSGMLPGWIAGHYPLEACAIPLAELASRAGVRFVGREAVGLDATGRQLRLDDGSTLGFDWLAMNPGSCTRLEELAGAQSHALPVRPIERFVEGIGELLGRHRAAPGAAVAVVGDGAAAVEIAFALHYRLARDDRPWLTLIGGRSLPLPGLAAGLRRRCVRLLEARGIGWHAGSPARTLDGSRVVLADGTRIAAAEVLLATGAGAPAWLRDSGLALDQRGFVRVTPALQSASHPFVFAAGDIASLPDARPKSGVFAVRAGSALADNLRRLIVGEPLRTWQPQRRALVLVSTGDRHALGAWGGLGWSGAWVWRWKDRIDRAFMRRFGNRHVG